MSEIYDVTVPDLRLPMVGILRLMCGHRLIVNLLSDAARNGAYTLGEDFACPACRYHYQRVKTVKGWPKGMDFLLACGHLLTGQPYLFNIDVRTSHVYHDTDVFCPTCSIAEGEDIFQ